MLQRMKHKGALFVEYALLFSFITLSGLILITSDGVSDSVGQIFRKAAATVGFAAQEEDRTLINFMEALKKSYFAEVDDDNNPTGKKFSAEPVFLVAATSLYTENDKTITSDDLINGKTLDGRPIEDQSFRNFLLEEFGAEGTGNKDLMDSLSKLENYSIFQDPVDNKNYITWTTEDLSTKKEGDSVKVMISELGNDSSTPVYYVGTTTYSTSGSTDSYTVANGSGRTSTIKPSNVLYTPSNNQVLGNTTQINQTAYTDPTEALIAYYALK